MTEDQPGTGRGQGRAAAPVDRTPTWGDEQAVRALLHRAVDGLQPAPDALSRIRRAVPARRARYRHTWTGAVLIAVVSAAAVPTLHGLGGLQLSDGSAAGAGASHSAAGPSASASPSPRRSRPAVPVPGPSGPAAEPSPVADPSATVPPSEPAGPPSPTTAGTAVDTNGTGSAPATAVGAGSSAATVPDCLRADLGHGGAALGAPDGTGRVYGVFMVTNVSGHSCALTDPGTVTAALGGGATGQVRVVQHAAGDPADGLPDPAGTSGRLLLSPTGSYRVAFAWVPDAICPASGSAGGAGIGAGTTPSPTGGGTGGSGGTGGTGGTGGSGSGSQAGGGASGPSGPSGAPFGRALHHGPVHGGPVRSNDSKARNGSKAGNDSKAGNGSKAGNASNGGNALNAGDASPAGDGGDPGAAGGSSSQPRSSGGASGGASSEPSPSPSTTPAAPSPSATPGRLTVAHRPLGADPDAVAVVIPDACSGGTLYRALPQAAP